MGKSKILFLLRNAYFIIGTLLRNLSRARSASGIRNAPSEAGGEILKMNIPLFSKLEVTICYFHV